MMLDYAALIALAIDMIWAPSAFSSLATFAIAASEPAMFTADWLFFWINQPFFKGSCRNHNLKY